MRLEYEIKVRGLHLERKVIFAGRVPQKELPGYYAACDLVVIPSCPPEAFGLALAQGMAAGKPVIGSNIPGVRTLIKDGEIGYLVQPGDEQGLADRIDHLINDREIRLTMGRSGRQRIEEKYTWQRVGERLLDLYQEVLQN